MAEPNEWWAFSHWTWNGNVIAPDAGASPAQLEVFEPGNVTAHFVEIPHTNLTVVVSPAASGTSAGGGHGHGGEHVEHVV